MGGKAGNIVKTAIIGAAIATGVGVLFAPGMIAAAGGALSYFATTFAIQATLGAIGNALAPKPESFTSANELRSRTVMAKQAIAARDIVYGEVKKSGTIVFLETTNANNDLHICLTLAGHEINAVKDVFFNDVKVRDTDLSDNVEVDADSGTTPDYSARVKLTAHFGDDNQEADANLVARTSFGPDHRLRGIAYLYSQMRYNQNTFANGLPNISAIVQGKKVFDPRTETTAYSNNAALCIRDYLSDTLYGLGASDAEIDDDSFITAANICDEDVDLLGGGTEKRYTINGVVDTSKQPQQILNDMLTSCGGTIFYANGKWKIKVGAYVTPTNTITNDDLRGPISIQTRNAGRDQFNAVKGIFVAPENNWQPTDFPELTSNVFENEDGGDRKYIDLTLPFTTSVATAQRLARQLLFRNREQIVASLPCKMTAFQYEVGDTVMLTNERFGWDQKVFEVISWNFAFNGNELGVDLTLKETSAGIYAWNANTDESDFTFNNSNLPSEYDIDAPGVTISDEVRVRNQEAISVLIVDVTSSDPFLSNFEVEARLQGDTTYTNLGQASGNRFELINVVDGGTYEVRARAINTFNVKSPFRNRTYQVIGQSDPPQDVTGFTANTISGALVLTWNPVTDPDLSHYKIRYSREVTGASYQNAVTLVEKIARPANSIIVEARPGTYFIRAVDKLGNGSINAASAVVTTVVSSVETLNVVETVNEHPDFTGVKDGVAYLSSDNSLILSTSATFDEIDGLFDAAVGLFDGGNGTVIEEGFYYFANSVDLTDKYTSRITADLDVSRIDYVDQFDAVPGLFDDRKGLFDGDPTAFDDTNVEFQVRTTDDDPNATPTWSDWRNFVVGDYSARAFEWRLRMTTQAGESSPQVFEASVTVDMPDRVAAEANISSGAGAKVVTFNPAFKVTPALSIVADDMATGDFFEITSKSASGFTITFKDSGGSAVDRTFDYVAKGYGRIET